MDAFVAAWERADVPAILELLAADARCLTESMFATPWKLMPVEANGQLAFACYQGDPGTGRFRLGAVNVVGLRAGRVAELAGSSTRPVGRHFGLPGER